MNFTYEERKWSQGSGLRKTLEASLFKPSFPFKIIERENLTTFFLKLQEEKNLYSDLSNQFNKKPELANVDYIVLGNVDVNVQTGKCLINISFIKLTGNEATNKLPLLVTVTKEQLLDDDEMRRVFDSEMQKFYDNYFIKQNSKNELSKVPDFYRELEKRDSVIRFLTNDATVKNNTINDLTFKVSILNQDILDVKEYSNIAKLNVIGTEIDPGGSIIQTSAISKLMQDNVWTYDQTKGSYNLKLTDTALKYTDTVIKRFPNFPFGYYSNILIKINLHQPDALIPVYLDKAIKILRVTTTIQGHKPAHDQALAQLKQLFKLP